MRSAPILALLTASAVSAQVGDQAVWHGGVQFLPAIRESCRSAKDCRACIASTMAKQAPAPAIAFTRLIGNEGWMREYRTAGRIGIAYVVYPMRDEQRILLVNGMPGLIDVDDVSKLPHKSMLADEVYSRIVTERPNARLCSSDRSNLKLPLIVQRPDGSQQIIVSYKLHDGDEHLGYSFFAFSFDPRGRYLGSRFVGFQAISQSKPPMHPIPVRAGEKFNLALPWDVPLEFDWTLADPGSDSVLKLAGSQNDSQKATQLWMFTVTGEGATEVVMRYASPKLPERVETLPLLVKASR